MNCFFFNSCVLKVLWHWHNRNLQIEPLENFLLERLVYCWTHLYNPLSRPHTRLSLLSAIYYLSVLSLTSYWKALRARKRPRAHGHSYQGWLMTKPHTISHCSLSSPLSSALSNMKCLRAFFVTIYGLSLFLWLTIIGFYRRQPCPDHTREHWWPGSLRRLTPEQAILWTHHPVLHRSVCKTTTQW